MYSIEKLDSIEVVYQTINISRACFVCDSEESVYDWITRLSFNDFSCGDVQSLDNLDVRMIVLTTHDICNLCETQWENINVVFCESHSAFNECFSYIIAQPQYYFIL